MAFSKELNTCVVFVGFYLGFFAYHARDRDVCRWHEAVVRVVDDECWVTKGETVDLKADLGGQFRKSLEFRKSCD